MKAIHTLIAEAVDLLGSVPGRVVIGLTGPPGAGKTTLAETLVGKLDSATPGEVYDNALRWLIPSHSDPHASHVVELCAFPGYSVCDCTDFVCRFGPLLKAGGATHIATGETHLAHNGTSS